MQIGDQNGDLERFYPPAVFALLVGLVVCLSPRVLYDGDTYTHLAAGGWMLEHASVLRHDPFSATFAGQPWTAHEWLSELLLAGAYRAGGLTGVLLLTALAAAAAFANLARHVGNTAGPRATAILVAAALVCIAPSILARPHVLALPLLELWVAELLAARRQQRPPGWWLLAVMLAWANLHGGFAFGLVIAALLALEASIARAPNVARWWAFVAAAVAAAALTPQGWDGLLFPVRLLQQRSLALVLEWQPVDFARDHGFEAVLLALLAALGSGRIRLPWFRLLLLLGLVHLSLTHVRHGVLLAVAGDLILAEPVGQAFRERRPAPRPLGRRWCWATAVATALLRLASPVAAADSPATPVAAVAELPPSVLAQPVLNSNQFGGYLALVGLHPFIDGRLELFGDAFVADYLALAQPGGARLRQTLERDRIGWALLSPDDPLVASFDRLAGWRRQYTDPLAVVFVRG